MYNPSFNELSKLGDSRYTLVMLAAKRAREIVDGAKPLIETESTKPISIAIEEMLQEKIKYRRPEIKGYK
ncbi:DNA-directed RNA polymerase subunit omega [Keratinibaculum paraultunense]|uniref:DNA-directed RNA polymerase subunit omega n=1 Tax=Keratinibaculum paraultunense TaxID=1278232 RepID=A0A4R3KWS5_9FIRM|nr:DNA-directed RNA polymerase subunit omega [Keratinibaculum paraultunense]QQY78726.1 DNA-directed RNA polymerase subunit omega [Keratinibaculum paraultunense]TCS89596.1 DNA-directed RNA polymerase subunit omega [Keratinibaculum paraultunense]